MCKTREEINAYLQLINILCLQLICPTVAAECSRVRMAVRAYDSTLAFARRKKSWVRHRFSPLFISPFPVQSSRRRNAISENRVVPRLFRTFHQARTDICAREHPNLTSIDRQLRRREGTRRFATDGVLQKTREKPMFRAPPTNVRMVNGRRVCDSARNLWLHPEVFGKPRTRLAESVANRRVLSRGCRTL